MGWQVFLWFLAPSVCCYSTKHPRPRPVQYTGPTPGSRVNLDHWGVMPCHGSELERGKGMMVKQKPHSH